MSYGEKFAGKIVELVVHQNHIEDVLEDIVGDIDGILNNIPSVEIERLQSLISKKIFLEFSNLEFEVYCDSIDFLRSSTNNQLHLLQALEKLTFIKFLRSSGIEYFLDITIQIDQGLDNSLTFIDIIHTKNTGSKLLFTNKLRDLQENENKYLKERILQYFETLKENSIPESLNITSNINYDVYLITQNTYLRIYSIHLTM
ncbi:hypothetical protein HON22_04610 [Candidatus Peregrinibacteria bacterium]|jgi:hypothetical protein|nr:hypothetical protein [Candidatus Peregrinibacteria bacterium]